MRVYKIETYLFAELPKELQKQLHFSFLEYRNNLFFSKEYPLLLSRFNLEEHQIIWENGEISLPTIHKDIADAFITALTKQHTSFMDSQIVQQKLDTFLYLKNGKQIEKEEVLDNEEAI